MRIIPSGRSYCPPIRAVKASNEATNSDEQGGGASSTAKVTRDPPGGPSPSRTGPLSDPGRPEAQRADGCAPRQCRFCWDERMPHVPSVGSSRTRYRATMATRLTTSRADRRCERAANMPARGGSAWATAMRFLRPQATSFTTRMASRGALPGAADAYSVGDRSCSPCEPAGTKAATLRPRIGHASLS